MCIYTYSALCNMNTVHAIISLTCIQLLAVPLGKSLYMISGSYIYIYTSSMNPTVLIVKGPYPKSAKLEFPKCSF